MADPAPTDLGSGASERAPAPAPERLAVTGHATILVAEDEVILRALIETILRPVGLRRPPRGRWCSRRRDRTQPADRSSSTDVLMPGQSGFELARAIRAVHPGLPVLVMSGHASAALEPHGLVHGDIVLQKPFTPERLAQAVRDGLVRAS